MTLADGVACTVFRGKAGGTEHFLAIKPRGYGDLGEQLREIEERYASAKRGLGLDDGTAVFRRIFVSDVINQAAAIRASSLYRSDPADPVAVSLVEQPPLPGLKIALLAYHIAGGTSLKKNRLTPQSIVIEKSGHRHLWTTGLCSRRSDPEASPFDQTREVFGDLVATLSECRATLRDHCLRTWIYLKDIDSFYDGMVAARGAVFAEQGMSGDTHFIASTGIEGACADRYDVVALDAYSNLDLQPRQVTFLNDYEKLCEARNYNVHFERGTRVAYADRAHLFISGTASIDKSGQVVHEGSIIPQLDHTLDNIEGLLRAGSATLSDLMHLIVYLRDPSDFTCVERRLADRFPDLPVVIVQGAVCRPQWLIEIEGIAICGNNAPTLPPF